MFSAVVAILFTITSPASTLIGPLTKPNGDVDLVSVTNHVTLMEQTVAGLQTQIQTTNTELTTVQADLKNTRQAFSTLQTGHNSAIKDLAVTQSQLKDALAEISSLKSDLQTAESEIIVLKTQVKPPTTPASYVNVTVIDVIGRDVKSNVAEIAALKSELQLVKLDINETKLGVDMLGDHLNSSVTIFNSSVCNESAVFAGNNTLDELDNLKQSMHFLELSLNATILEVVDVAEHLNATQAELVDARGQLMSSAAEMNNTRTEIDILKETTHGLEMNIQENNASLNNMSLTIDHLETDVAFQASPSAYYFDLKDFQKLVYDSVFYNVGGGYNGTAGEFIAPFSGTYMFWAGTSTFGANTKVTIRLHLNHDRHGYLAQGTAISTLNATESTATVVTVARLQQSDVVWLEKYSGTDRLFGTQESYIGGVLLRRH